MLARLTSLRIALFCGVALSVMRFSGCLYLELVDARVVDYRLLQRGTRPATPDVVIVAIDDASIEVLGRWPWSRAAVAGLLGRLTAAEPAVIGFDIVQSEPTAQPGVEAVLERAPDLDQRTRAAVRRAVRAALNDDERLVQAVRASGRAVLGYFFETEAEAESGPAPSFGTYNLVYKSSGGVGERRVPVRPHAVTNLPALTAAARDTGYFNIIPDRDGSVRRLPLVIRFGDEWALPLSLAMLRVYSGQPVGIRFAEFGVDAVRLGARTVPVAEDGQMLLNYRGPGQTVRHVPAAEVLAGRVPPETFRGKLVLVGVTATAVGDIRVTPFDGLYPGVEVHATAIDNILRGDFLWQPKGLVVVEIAVILAAALLLGFILRCARGMLALLAAVVMLAGYLAGSQWVFMSRGVPLSLVYPMLAIALTYVAASLQHYLVEERERRKMRSALELYLSPSMARLVSEQPDRLKLGGEKRELSVLFSDIRGFTAISEGLEPEALVDLLNVYLGGMTDVIFRHAGMLDKYIGDAVMAVWGAPLPQADHAARACAAALEMQTHLTRLNDEWRGRGWPVLHVGVGLNTGPMIFGNMGSAHHLSLTVMGDNVNLGSRLEGLTKFYGVDIIASEATVRAAGSGFVVRELDQVRVKGKALPVRIFEILGPASEQARWAPRVEQFQAGLAAYRQRRWDDAADCFASLTANGVDDGPAALYLQRCEALRAAPPPPEWDGVTVMEGK